MNGRISEQIEAIVFDISKQLSLSVSMIERRGAEYRVG